MEVEGDEEVEVGRVVDEEEGLLDVIRVPVLIKVISAYLYRLV